MTDLARVLPILVEDLSFALVAATKDAHDAATGLRKRREDTVRQVETGTPTPRMTEAFDAWLFELCRAAAPIAPPMWLPMAEVLKEKVTLEVGARGFRSLFSSKPSEKDRLRVKNLGGLATRVLKATLGADGEIDADEARTIEAFVASLGLPEEDAKELLAEAPLSADGLIVAGEIDAVLLRAIVRGAWLGAAWDNIDPREEAVIRTFAQKASLPPADSEKARAEAIERVDARRLLGLAVVDGVRHVLADRMKDDGLKLATALGTLILPKKYREEALGPVAYGSPVVLGKRYISLSGDDRLLAMELVWLAALWSDPTVSRMAELRARHDAFAKDLEDTGKKGRAFVEAELEEALSVMRQAT